MDAGPKMMHDASEVDEIVRKAEFQNRQLALLKEATSSFLRRDARLSSLREQTLLLRSRAKFEWRNCHNYRRFVRESQVAFNEEAAAVISSTGAEDYEERLTKLQSLHDQVMRDFEAQNEYAERANALQTELGDLEYELQMKEVSVKDAAETMKRILNELVLPNSSTAATATETEVPPSTLSGSSEELNPLIENYFQKAGIVNNLQELSIELEVDYVEARGERVFKFEHEQALDITEEEFELLWQESRNELAQKLTEARRVADTAMNACLDNDLDPEKHRMRSPKESDRAVSNSTQDEISRLLPPGIELSGIDLSGIETTGFFDLKSESDGGRDGIPILTPETYPTRTSREGRSENQPQHAPPLKDRVISWMEQVDGQHLQAEADGAGAQQASMLPRRSISVSSPLSRSEKSQFYPPLPGSGSAMRLDQDELWRSIQEASPGDIELQRRRSSDSNMAAMLSKHDPTSAFVDGLRQFAAYDRR